MQNVLLLVCFVALAFAAAPGRLNAHTESEQQFVAWMKDQGKTYATTEEYAMRLQNFRDTLSRIATRNGKSNATYAVNKFSDLTQAEFRMKYLMKKNFEPCH